MVNEPSVFEPLKFYCSFIYMVKPKTAGLRNTVRSTADCSSTCSKLESHFHGEMSWKEIISSHSPTSRRVVVSYYQNPVHKLLGNRLED